MDALFEVKRGGDNLGNSPAATIPYRLLKPKTIADNQKYPLLLFLHGAGERGTDNVSQLNFLPTQMAAEPWRTEFPCFLIAPQCPPGQRWVEVEWGDRHSRPVSAPNAAMAAVLQILDTELQQLPVDRTRVYLTGLSMGGFGAWDLAARLPGMFAAVAPICGGGDEQTTARLVNLPIWAWHGTADDVVPVERSRQMIAAIQAAGGNPRYTELAGVGHQSWLPAYEDRDGVVPWMFAQQRQLG
jgi:predicted peptidase